MEEEKTSISRLLPLSF